MKMRNLRFALVGWVFAFAAMPLYAHSDSRLRVQDQQSSPKPLTKQLSESFGDKHNVASSTAFITTALAGKLTKAQLVDHLQQRALIHEEIDKVLSASTVQPLPYGPAQKEMIPLLRGDLKAMHAKWPKSTQAWPLTQGMLDRIKESAATGPYYALGVFHVYYGGVTHGGREIGAMITNQLKVELNYYQNTDGYEDYFKQVNEIADPAAQKEMIRGADDAYDYIIAVNNQDSFKPTANSKPR